MISKKTKLKNKDLILDDSINSSSYLDWLKENHNGIYKFFMNYDRYLISQKVYKVLYINGFLSLKNPYVLKYEEDDGIFFQINASEMFRKYPFLYDYLKNMFKGNQQILFDKYFSCYAS